MPSLVVVAADRERSAQALVGEGRAASGCRSRRRPAGSRPRLPQVGGVPTAPATAWPRSTRSWARPVADDGRVLGDGDPHARHQARDGRSTVTTVGPPGGLTRFSRPSTARTRSVSPARPLDGTRPRAPPQPSSRTTQPQPVPCSVTHLQRASAGRRVLGHVGQQLGHAEVGDGLDGRRRALGQVGRQLGRDGAAGGQGGQRALQPVVERRRVDPAGDFAQFDDGLLGAPVGRLHQFQGPGEIAGPVR